MPHHTGLKMYILCAMFAAITAVFTQLAVPTPFVPFTMQTLAVGLAATILGSRYGALSMLVYIALGSIGIPVFSEFRGGVYMLAGPTGGFIIGFVFAAFATGYFLEKTRFTIFMALIANLIGMVITLAFGVVQLKFVADLSWQAAMMAGVYPFIPFGIVKAILAAWLGITTRRRLIENHLLPSNKTTKKEAPVSTNAS